ncbi:MAG: putative ATP-dependent RNA helicase DDX1, partial [Streblomastix strix]
SQQQKGGSSSNSPCSPRVIILEPARELAEQTMKAIEEISKFLPPPGIKVGLLIGGGETQTLTKDTDIVIGTVGKSFELMDKLSLSFKNLVAFVIDEADRVMGEEQLGGGSDPQPWNLLQEAKKQTQLRNQAQMSAIHAIKEAKLRRAKEQEKEKEKEKKKEIIKDIEERRKKSGEDGEEDKGDDEDDENEEKKGQDEQEDQFIESRSMQVILVSATLHTPQMAKVIERATEFPTWVDLKGDRAVPETVHHAYISVNPTQNWKEPTGTQIQTDGIYELDGQPRSADHKNSQLIKKMKPWILKQAIDKLRPEQAFIFVRTKLDCDNLEKFFKQFQVKSALESVYSCVVLHSDRPQHERRLNFEQFKAGDVKYLICTDVAARGLDIQQLPCVFNYTLPDTEEQYIHRIGRVGRVDRWGLAVSLVGSEKEKVWYHKCPSRGKNCRNTRLVDEGGCCIWYNEPDLWEQIKGRLSGEPKGSKSKLEIPTLEEHMRLVKKTAYGQSRSVASVKSHSSLIAQSVERLKTLDSQVQLSYTEFLQKYS